MPSKSSDSSSRAILIIREWRTAKLHQCHFLFCSSAMSNLGSSLAHHRYSLGAEMCPSTKHQSLNLQNIPHQILTFFRLIGRAQILGLKFIFLPITKSSVGICKKRPNTWPIRSNWGGPEHKLNSERVDQKVEEPAFSKVWLHYYRHCV